MNCRRARQCICNEDFQNRQVDDVSHELMAEVCLSNGEQLELEKLCPRNSSLETVNTHLGRLMWRPWRRSSSKTWRRFCT